MLDLSRTKQAEAIFEVLIQMPREHRSSALHERCKGDTELGQLVERLLQADEAAGARRFLVDPAALGGLAPPAPAEQTLPERMGDFRILRRLSEGGMGIVFEAEQAHPRRIVALKVIRGGRFVDRLQVKLFQREVQALARLRHSGIGAIYEAGQTDEGQHFFAMEYVDGRPLMEYVHDRRLGLRQRLALFVQICDAIHYAHQRGVMHRDLKPSNILIDADGRPKILDFGLARISDDQFGPDFTRTVAGRVQGTLPYMSPEQARGDVQEIDVRSDVYSLGVMLYEMLGGRLPFDLADLPLPEAVKKVCEQPIPHLKASADLGTLHRDLDNIVRKAMSKEPARRYAGAAALAEDVQRFLRNEPVQAAPPAIGYRIRKFIQRNPIPVVATGVIMLTLIVSTIGLTRLYFRTATAEHDRSVALTKALGESKRADAQAAEAKRQAVLAGQVAEFQSSVLSQIDLAAMGRGVKSRFREEVRQGLESQYIVDRDEYRRRTDEEVHAEVGQFDRLAAEADTVDVARLLIDEYVLKRAAEAARLEYADQPLVRAQIEDSLGTTYQSLGLLAEAEPLLRSALDIRRQALGADHEQVAKSLNHLGALLWTRGTFDEAATVHQQALDMRRKLQGAESQGVASSLLNLGLTLKSKGQLDEAEAHIRQALTMQRKLLSEDHEDIARSLTSLASTLRQKGDNAGAEPLYREALAMKRRLYGAESASLATSINNFAVFLNAKGDKTQAEKLYREALEMRRRLLGNEHPDVAGTMHNLGALLRERGDLAQAEPMIRESLALHRRLMGDGHPNLGVGLNNLGLLLRAKGDSAGAEVAYREALALNLKCYGPWHVEVGICLNNLAILLQSQKDLDGAEASCRQAATVFQRQGAKHNSNLAVSLNILGAVLRDKGDLDGAEKSYREALAMRRQIHGDSDPRLALAMNNLSLLLRMKGDLTAAESLDRESLAIHARKSPPDHPDFAWARVCLGRTLARQGKFSEAQDMLLTAEKSLSSLGGKSKYLKNCREGLTELYTAWHAADPNQGYDAKAQTYQALLKE